LKAIGWLIPPPENSDLVAYMEMVLNVYKTSCCKRFPVICMDESPKQLIKQTCIPIARKPGMDAREEYEYARNGVGIFFWSQTIERQTQYKGVIK
jgi:hypothetical protein